MPAINPFPEGYAKTLLSLAGFTVTESFKLTNQYWPACDRYREDIQDSPWWAFKTQHGVIVIGWRKRVIEIDWRFTAYRGKVTSDNVTQVDGSLAHAWSPIKAIEYLTFLKETLDATV